MSFINVFSGDEEPWRTSGLSSIPAALHGFISEVTPGVRHVQQISVGSVVCILTNKHLTLIVLSDVLCARRKFRSQGNCNPVRRELHTGGQRSRHEEAANKNGLGAFGPIKAKIDVTVPLKSR